MYYYIIFTFILFYYNICIIILCLFLYYIICIPILFLYYIYSNVMFTRILFYHIKFIIILLLNNNNNITIILCINVQFYLFLIKHFLNSGSSF